MTNKAVRFITTNRQKDRLEAGSKELSVIIPTAGMGYRMKAYGSKALLYFQNEPLLHRQITTIKHVYPYADIIVVVGFESQKIMNNISGVRFVENENYETTNVLRSIAMGLRATITNRVLIVYGDIIFNIDALKNSDNESWTIGDSNNLLKKTSIGITGHNAHAVHFAYDLDIKWGKILHLCNNELKLFKKIAYDNNNRKMLGYEALNLIIDKGAQIKLYTNPKYKIFEIDSYKDIQDITL